jgi:hypothetical protein
MKGFFGLTKSEQDDILKQHSKPYDGYAVGNVNTNMYPLTVYNDARDSEGVTVTSNGNIKSYTNHQINEITAKPLNYDEIDNAYEFESQGPQQSMVLDIYDEKAAYNFKSKGPSDVFEEPEFEDPDFDSLLDADEDIEKEREEIEESVLKTMDMFKRFQKYN